MCKLKKKYNNNEENISHVMIHRRVIHGSSDPFVNKKTNYNETVEEKGSCTAYTIGYIGVTG